MEDERRQTKQMRKKIVSDVKFGISVEDIPIRNKLFYQRLS